MIPGIRVRIGLGVFAVVVALLMIQMLIVLDQVRTSLESEVDAGLLDDLEEVQPWLGKPGLQAMIDREMERRRKWKEIFFEIRDAGGRRLAATRNVPAAGLPGTGPSVPEGEVRFRDEVHPASRKRHRHIRVADTRMGPYRVQVASTLEPQQKQYWALREQLLWVLLIVATLGAGAAYLVATRALAPVRRIAARARELQALSEGELPRTGSGDEIDRLATVLNDLLQRIREEVSRMQRMTADAGHALRTPLTAIRGNLELGIGRVPEQEAEHLSGVLEEVDRLIRLVNQLLLLEKLEASAASSARHERFDLAALAEEIVDHVRVIAEDRGICLECVTRSAPVRGDRSQIRQALLNLLENALRHTPRGGRIVLEVGSSQGRARASVSDTGPGLGAEDLERAFERFYSAPGSHGTGLGLPIARAIARAHGGELRASSPGGAVFVLDLPAAP